MCIIRPNDLTLFWCSRHMQKGIVVANGTVFRKCPQKADFLLCAIFGHIVHKNLFFI